jgi:hypothetical protein
MGLWGARPPRSPFDAPRVKQPLDIRNPLRRGVRWLVPQSGRADTALDSLVWPFYIDLEPLSSFPIFLYLSNFGSPPAQPEDFLRIKNPLNYSMSPRCLSK